MNINLLAEGLDGSLAEIVAKLQSLIDSFWIYIVIALAAVVVIWGAYIGIKIAIAHRNEEKINARDCRACGTARLHTSLYAPSRFPRPPRLSPKSYPIFYERKMRAARCSPPFIFR